MSTGILEKTNSTTKSTISNFELVGYALHMSMIFEEAFDRGYSFASFLSVFSALHYDERLYEDISLRSQSHKYFINKMEAEAKESGIILQKGDQSNMQEVFAWFGYLYGLWYQLESIPLSVILEKCLPEELDRQYDCLHTQSSQYAIHSLKKEYEILWEAKAAS